jgi:hypothetical protein
MDRLSIILTLISGSLVTGALVITLFSLGYYTWWAVALSAGIGFVMAWPSALILSRRIKSNDAEWSRDYDPKRDGVLPKPSGKEI